MKRWRDEQQLVRLAVKSIVLQVLVAECMPSGVDDAARMAQTFRALYQKLRVLDEPPVVPNPALLSENLAKHWTQTSFHNFVKELAEAVEFAEAAQASNDEVEAADLWRELLGDDFPIPSAGQLGLELLDQSHAQTPAQKGWSEAHDSRYRVSITADVQRGRRNQNIREVESGVLLREGHNLHFRANVVAPNHVEVWWQVVNTGGHARSQGGLRGDIFKGHDLKNNQIAQDEDWERTEYTGSHLIRALLVRENRVLAASEFFRVNIYATGHPFTR
jgi:hypothetical protein